MHLRVDHVGYAVPDLTKMVAPGDIEDRRASGRKQRLSTSDAAERWHHVT